MTNYFRSLIRLYQILLSPLIGGECRFYPTCSAYALESLVELPLPTALFRIIKRLASCHPFHPGGYDPVVSTKGLLS